MAVNQSIIILLLCFISSLPIIVNSVRITTTGLKDDYDKCVYSVYIRTGSIWKSGTDSVISLGLAGPDGTGFYIDNLESWGGLMGPDYNYFENGNLDVFSGLGPCLDSWPPCKVNVTSDGSGDHHGWYCSYVEVTSTGPHKGCAQQKFDVNQWIARDAPPYQLSTVRDYCPAPSGDEGVEGSRGHEHARLVRSE